MGFSKGRFSLLLAGALSLTAFASAQSVVSEVQGRISVHARNVPLSRLLSELSEIVEIESMVVDPGIEETPISLELDNVPIEEGIAEILEAADVNYTVWGGEGEPFRIFAGRPEGAVKSRSIEPPEAGDEVAVPPGFPPEEEPEPPSPADGSPGVPSPSAGVGGLPLVPGSVPTTRPPPRAPGEPAPPNRPPSQSPGQQTTPSHPPSQVPGEGGVQSPPRAPPFPPPGLPESNAWATGTAILATDSAVRDKQPTAVQVAVTVTILFSGLLLGVALVTAHANEGHSIGSARRRNGE
jgi:hypothetical protein